MPLNRMVKPTIDICCDFAQKHGSEFVQNFFDKPLDIFARRVYNDIVPERKERKTSSRTRRERGTE